MDEVGLGHFGNDFGQERFAAARRTVKEHAFGRLHAVLLENLAVHERHLNGLAQGVLHFLQTRHIVPAQLRSGDDLDLGRLAGAAPVLVRDLLVGSQHLQRQRRFCSADRGDQRGHRNHALLCAQQGFEDRLPAHRLDVGPGEALGQRRQLVAVHLFGQRLVLEVTLENAPARRGIRRADINDLVEPPRTQGRRINQFRMVGGADQEDAVQVRYPIGVRQERRQDALLRRIRTRQLGPPGKESLQFIEEKDRRPVLARGLKDFPQVGFRLAIPLAGELSAADGVKRGPGLARDEAGELGLAGTGGAEKQHAFRRLEGEPAKRFPLGRIKMRTHCLADFRLNVVHSRQFAPIILGRFVGARRRAAPKLARDC